MDTPLDVFKAVDDGTVKCTAVLGKRLAWSAYYVRKQR